MKVEIILESDEERKQMFEFLTKNRQETKTETASNTNKKWSKEEDQFLIANYHKYKAKKLVSMMNGRSHTSIAARAAVLRRMNKLDLKHKSLTAQELEFIKSNYTKLSDKDISIKLSRCITTVKNEIKRLQTQTQDKHKLAKLWIEEGMPPEIKIR